MKHEANSLKLCVPETQLLLECQTLAPISRARFLEQAISKEKFLMNKFGSAVYFGLRFFIRLDWKKAGMELTSTPSDVLLE